jgi:hypothetical protein
MSNTSQTRYDFRAIEVGDYIQIPVPDHRTREQHRRSGNRLACEWSQYTGGKFRTKMYETGIMIWRES